MSTLTPGRLLIRTIDHLLPPGECERFIRESEAQGCEEAPITTITGFVMRPDIRTNTRVIRDDVALARWFAPERGRALTFAHAPRHQGAPPVRGCKYVLRTDVLYRCQAPNRTSVF